jgi:hypothetical protein
MSLTNVLQDMGIFPNALATILHLLTVEQNQFISTTPNL